MINQISIVVILFLSFLFFFYFWNDFWFVFVNRSYEKLLAIRTCSWIISYIFVHFFIFLPFSSLSLSSSSSSPSTFYLPIFFFFCYQNLLFRTSKDSNRKKKRKTKRWEEEKLLFLKLNFSLKNKQFYSTFFLWQFTTKMVMVI